MDGPFRYVLEFLNSLTFGSLGRAGMPDPVELRRERVHDDRIRRSERGRLVGGSGIAATPLRPSGRVVIDGRVHEAVSESGFIDRGMTVEVIGSRAFGLVVRPVSGNPTG